MSLLSNMMMVPWQWNSIKGSESFKVSSEFILQLFIIKTAFFSHFFLEYFCLTHVKTIIGFVGGFHDSITEDPYYITRVSWNWFLTFISLFWGPAHFVLERFEIGLSNFYWVKILRSWPGRLLFIQLFKTKMQHINVCLIKLQHKVSLSFIFFPFVLGGDSYFKAFIY